MKNMCFKSWVFVLPLFLMSFGVMAQGTVKGKVLDLQTREPLVGAAIMLDGTTEGVSADLDGSFSLKSAKNGKQVLVFRCIGYQEIRKEIVLGKDVNVGIIGLRSESIGLGDVTVTASVAVSRKTPVAVAIIAPNDIENKLSTQEYPEMLKAVPGAYATKQGGGHGDGRANIRGFESENVALMVNGVPMNDMEWGGVYWSNWSGLSDVTRSMQVQRGLGASKISAPSVGGSINIVTRTTDVNAGGSVSYALGQDGYNKVGLNVSTGLKNGWALSLLGTKSWGNGYVQGTEFEGYSYFGNISKQINERHLLSFTVFGAPQWHNQRNFNDKLTIEEWQKQGNKYKYNPSYGFGPNGQQRTSSYNRFHKPQISLNHSWTINEKSSLSTVAYVSLGRGYGNSGQGQGSYRSAWYGATGGVSNTLFRATDGTFDYNAIYELNRKSDNGSKMVMARSVNEHNWYGLMSTYTTKLGKYFDIYAGLDLRYYKAVHKTVLDDLYGGDFYVDNASRKSVEYMKDNREWQNEKLKKGDVVFRNYDGYAHQEGVFGQVEYNRNALNAFVSASVSSTTYWRYDHFYYDEANARSEKASFVGYTVKGGANYNLTEKHNVFANIGYISRVPFSSKGVFLQSDVSNVVNKDAVNEKVFSMELGYGYRSTMLSVNLNVYRTMWMDKMMAKYFDLVDDERCTMNIMGVDARHQGIELDFVLRPVRNLDITGMFSFGDWQWNSDAVGYAYNSMGQPLKNDKGEVASGIQAIDHAKMKLNLKGVRVGNSAQTTAAIGANYQLMKGLRAGADFTYFGRNYANFKIAGDDIAMNGEKTYESPWKIPSAGTVDMNVSYRFEVGKVNAVVSGNVNNLLDQEYIMDAEDGTNHDWKTSRVFYGFGRTYSVQFRLNF